MDFVEWIESELSKRDWSRADFARKGKFSTAQVTRVLNREQKAGEAFCRGVSVAFNVPQEEIFRRAGLLSLADARSELANRAAHLIDSMEDNNKQEGVRYLEYLYDKSRKVINKRITE